MTIRLAPAPAPWLVPLLLVACSTHATGGAVALQTLTPEGLDLYLPVPTDNPLTPARIALGERLLSGPPNSLANCVAWL